MGIVRAQAMCLLTRLGHLDSGARAAAQRRAVGMREEELLRREQRSYHQAYMRGRRVRGQLVT